MPEPLLALESISQQYPNPGGHGFFTALHAVSISLQRGESLGLAGESGAGKSTLARLVLGLEKPSSGRVLLGGIDLAKLDRNRQKAIKRRVQIIWQDPYLYLNPYYTVQKLIEEPLRVLNLASGAKLGPRVRELLELVDLPGGCLESRPHELSGGQCQRVAIARALAVEPELLICDEALASLDLPQQARILSILKNLQEQTRMSYLFISHDFAALRTICTSIAVLKTGRLVEMGSTDRIINQPRHPYTQSLVRAWLDLWAVNQ